jgi:hypothetical protein
MVMLLVVGTSIWVLADASNIGARRGLVPGSCDYGPGGWFLICLLLWIVGFPAYLITRPKIVAAAKAGLSDAEIEAVTGKKVLRGGQRRARAYRDQVEEWERRQAIQQGQIPTQPKPEAKIAIAAIDCPLCSRKIPAAGVRIGRNVCPECGGAYDAEAS